MKFGHSERDFHPLTSYNPPSNYYQPIDSHKKILTGSLNGPAFATQQNIFGLSKRFKEKQDRIPGPGAYSSSVVQKVGSESIIEKTKVRQYRKQAILGASENSPSIPYNQLKIEQEDAEQLRELMCAQDINRSALYMKKRNDGFTFHKSDRKLRSIQEQQPIRPAQSYQSRQIGLLQREPRQKVNMQEKIKKSIERRNQIIKTINPEFVPSLELIELINKRRTTYIPGPGAYQHLQTHQHTTSFPTAQRFTTENSSVGPGQYTLIEQRTKASSFCRSSRNVLDKGSLDSDLQHRFYIDPYENIKKRETQSIKSTVNNAFGSQLERFSLLDKETIEIGKKERKSRIEEVVEKRLKKMHILERKCNQSQGLLALSTMASLIE